MSPRLRPCVPARRHRAPARGLPCAALALALHSACELDTGGMGVPPVGVATSGEGTTTAASEGSSDGLDSTGQPVVDGPRKRRLDLDPGLAAGAGGTTLLVVLDPSRIEYADTMPGGADLRFFGPQEQAAYPIEIEHWDPQGRSFVWVRIEAAELPDHLWMYYGDGEGFAAIEPAAVWDGAFAAVWHMERGADTQMPDTTANGHDLTFIDFAGQIDVEGQIGHAAAFQPPAMLADAGPLELRDPAALALTEGFTLEAWVLPAVTADDTTHYALRKAGAYELRTLEPTSTRPKIVVRTEGGTGAHLAEAGATLSLDQWTYLAATYRTDDGTLSIYRNGVLEGAVTVDGDATSRALAQTSTLVQVGRTFRGRLDEIRVSTIARSPAWIRLQHASMSDALLTFGDPQPR